MVCKHVCGPVENVLASKVKWNFFFSLIFADRETLSTRAEVVDQIFKRNLLSQAIIRDIEGFDSVKSLVMAVF
jgi:hypothetical protein